MQSFSFSFEFFSGKFGKIWAKILPTPKNLSAPAPMTEEMSGTHCKNTWLSGSSAELVVEKQTLNTW